MAPVWPARRGVHDNSLPRCSISCWMLSGSAMLTLPGAPRTMLSCGQKLGLPGGGSCTRTRIAFERLWLYLKSGKRIRETIRQLGYPTKNSLISWHREYERRHDLRTGYVRSRPRYSASLSNRAGSRSTSQARRQSAVIGGYCVPHGPASKASSAPRLPWPSEPGRLA